MIIIFIYVIYNVFSNLLADMCEKKELLSQEEIARIIEESTKQHFKDPNILVIAKKRTDVIRVTPINQLIFIEGDQNTGFKHINQRHMQFQETPNWRKARAEDGSNIWQLQQHSFFSIFTVPIFDYPKIADSIYKSENLTIKENTNPDCYDLFAGNFNSQKDGIIPFKLLLYKGTKIVHNLYPNTIKFTPKRVLNYKKGSVGATYDVMKRKATIQVPYYDRKNLVKYKIVFHQDYFHKKEKIFIERLNYDSKTSNIFFITERHLPYNDFDALRLDVMNISELPNLENIILSIEKIP